MSWEAKFSSKMEFVRSEEWLPVIIWQTAGENGVTEDQTGGSKEA